MFERVIVPLDGSAIAMQALPVAGLMPAKRWELLSVLPAQDEMSGFWESESHFEQWLAAVEAGAREWLDEGAAVLAGKEVEKTIVIGEPAETIIASAGPDDLIVMTTRGHGAGRRFLYGSVADRVSRHAQSPVLLVHAQDETAMPSKLARIVVPLDGSDRSEEAVPVATMLAQALKIPVVLVRALDIEMLRSAVRAGATAATAYAESQETVRHAVDFYLAELAGPMREQGITVATEIRDNSPDDELLAMTTVDDLIVMTSHGHGGVKRWLLGSVAEKLIRHVSCPVLLVRAS